MNNLGMVIKLSSSNIPASAEFYTKVLGCVIDKRYTLCKGNFGPESYMQLDLPGLSKNIAIGLYRDIDYPLPVLNFGTALTFVVADLKELIKKLTAKGVKVGDVITNTSDDGYTDIFASFCDPDNNVLYIRENLEKKVKLRLMPLK